MIGEAFRAADDVLFLFKTLMIYLLPVCDSMCPATVSDIMWCHSAALSPNAYVCFPSTQGNG